jgi:chromosomal replication initiator protein
MEGIWSAALPALREQLGERNFVTWIAPIRCIEAGDEIRLEVASSFFQQWVTRHFLPTIEATLARVLGVPCTVRLVIAPDGDARAERKSPAASPAVPEKTAVAAAADRISAPIDVVEGPPIDQPRIGSVSRRYTFDNFIVGEANRVAFQAAQTVSRAPGRRFSPVFVHGGTGLGKTHLINALARDMLARQGRRFRIACLAAESFMNTLIASLRRDEMNAFRERFRQLDALILDDVQFLAGKERTQEEFFHTFNSLYAAQKQIVLTSDKPPSAIDGLECRLRSRFEGGLIADIHPPTPEMRVAIVAAKAKEQQVDLAPEVVELIVSRAGPSVRELEGVLNCVLATAGVRAAPITRELTEAALRPFPVHRATVSVEKVQETVSVRFGLSVHDLISHRRGRDLSYPRQLAMYLSRTIAEESFGRIGDKFGGRDHSTVMYAVRSIEARRKSEPAVEQMLSGIESDLRGPG